MEENHPNGNSVAVIGMAGRFPGAHSLDAFWKNLAQGRDLVSRFSREQAMASGLEPDVWEDPGFVPANGILSEGDCFDAGFFKYTPREAELIDPQQRVFLECAWHALESAGYTANDFNGRIGIFAGSGYSYYLMEQMRRDCRHPASGSSFLRLMGNDKDYLTTRAAYKLDLTGPALNVATACSTSLVAVHLACQSLLAGESDMALAGGVKINSPQYLGHLHQTDSAFSADGRNLAFKKPASGTVGGNGVGLVVLKELDKALANGDNIRAVILGSAVNNDGADKIGYTAPSRDAQAEVIAEALEMAGVPAYSLGYLEAHGTATALGDGLEVAALKEAFGQSNGHGNYCALGTVKSNIGHLDSAAGVAGLIKTVLMLEHGQIPPDPHTEEPNPELNLANSPFYINRELAPWPQKLGTARAGVSSFGVGGVNAHLVLEQAPKIEKKEQDGPGLLVFSAPSEDQLHALGASYLDHLSQDHDLALSDLCYTAAAGRAHFPWRKALVARNLEHLTNQLQDWLSAPQAAHVSNLDSAPGYTLKVSLPETGSGRGEQLLNDLGDLQRRFPAFGRSWKEIREAWEKGKGSELKIPELASAAMLAAARFLIRLAGEPRAIDASRDALWAGAFLAGALDLDQAIAWQLGRQPSDLARPRIDLYCQGQAWDGRGDDDSNAQPPSADGFSRSLIEPVLNLGISAPQGADFLFVEGWLSLLAQAYEKGVNLDWSKVWDPAKVRRAELPLFPFDSKPYYIGPGLGVSRIQADQALWESLLKEGELQAQASAHILGPEKLAQENSLMEDVSASFVARAFAKTKAFEQIDRKITAQEFAEQAGVVPELTQLSKRLLAGLVRAGYLEGDSKGFWSLYPPEEQEHQELLAETQALWQDNPAMRDIYPLIGENLLEILTGEKDLREIYFPKGDLSTAHSIYADLPTSRYFNGLMASLLSALCQNSPWRDLRILEVGAGTGATSESLLNELPGSIREYCFTDVSNHFLDNARDRFSRHGFMEYRLFDLERWAGDQGLERGAYDLVVAANSAHVAGDMRRAVQNLRYTLRPGGLMLLYEITENSLLGEMTTSLILPPCDDEDLRPDGPFMSPEQWKSLLLKTGFASVACFPGQDSPAAQVGERVILARADGRSEDYGAQAFSPRQTAPSKARPEPTAEEAAHGPRLYQTNWVEAKQASGELPIDGSTPLLLLVPGECNPKKTGALANELETLGAPVKLVTGKEAGDAREISDALLLLAQEPGLVRVVWLAPNPDPDSAGSSIDGQKLQAVAEEACLAFLGLTQALDQMGWNLASTTLLVAQAFPAKGGQGSVYPLSGLWSAFGRVMALGHPELNLQVADLEADWDVGQIAPLLAQSNLDPGEAWWSFRDGKILVPRLNALEDISPQQLRLSSEATYLLAGGLGGLGLETAKRLVKRGAKHLLFLGRSAPGPEASQKLRDFEDQGVKVHTAQVDLARLDELERVISNASKIMPPIRGVVHTAVNQGWDMARLSTGERLASVFDPKVAGGWNLHLASLELDLDFFWLFSSAVTMTPISGLPDYAGSNGFLEALACHRRALGLPGLALAWGSWSSVGAVAADPYSIRLVKQGLTPLEPDQALDLLEAGQATGKAVLGAMDMDWQTRLATLGGSVPAYYELLAAQGLGGTESHSRQSSMAGKLKAAAPEKRPAMLGEYLVNTFASILKIPAAEIDPKVDLVQVGLDSLMFLDVAGIIGRELGIRINPKDLYQDFNIASITTRFLETLENQEPVPLEKEDLAGSLESFFEADPQNRYEPFPLTDMQQAYWVGRRADFEMGNIAAHGYVELEGKDWDIKRLNQAWQKVVERHDMFRAVILEDGTQRILPEVPFYEFEVLDLSDLSESAQQERIELLREEMSHKLQDPGQWPLFDIRLSLLGQGRMRLHFSLDNLTTDGRSLNIFMGEWVELYLHPDKDLPTAELSFRDYVMAMRRFQSSAEYEKIWEYWASRLDDLPYAPRLPMLKNPNQVEKPHFVRRGLSLDKTRWDALKQAARQRGLTLPGLLAAAYAEVLCLYSGQDRITLNLPTFNRLPVHPEVNRILGEFTSLLFLEVDNSQPLPFEKRAQAIQAQIFSDLDQGGYVSGMQILRELSRRRGGIHKATMPVVFSSMFGLANQSDSFAYDFAAMEKFGEQVTGISQTPQVWLDNHIHEAKGRLNIYWDAVEELFPPDLITNMFSAYKQLLSDLAEKPETWLKESPLVQLEKERQSRSAYNQTTAPVSQELMHGLFQRSRQKSPQGTALVQGQLAMTYDQVGCLSTSLAGLMRLMGVKPNQTVAVCCQRGWEQAVAALAVLEAGGAYVPIDPDAPAKRLAMLVEQSQAKVVLTQSSLAEKISLPAGVQVIEVDQQEPVEPGTASLPPVQKTTDLAYVIYTSGSTGTPKGVAIDHRGAVNTILDINQRFSVRPDDAVLALSAFNFDLSVYDLFGLWAAGGKVVMIDHGHHRDPAHWRDLMERHSVTIWNTVPSLMQMLVEDISGSDRKGLKLRQTLLSGDWIPLDLPSQIQDAFPSCALCSLGGATEASIWSIFYPVEQVDTKWKSIPYGCPLTNQSMHVLNSRLNECPDWVTGDIYIGGIGLAREYWGDPEKTAQKFITHPQSGERLYHTGDLGRFLPEGYVEFLGREDHQVKIGGHRIELGEIESAYRDEIGVGDVLVMPVGGERRLTGLAAYMTAKEADLPLATTPKIADQPEVIGIWPRIMDTGLVERGPDTQEVQGTEPLERLHQEAVHSALIKLGAFSDGRPQTLESLRAGSGLAPRYTKWLARAVRALRQAGLLEQKQDGSLARTDKWGRPDIEAAWKDAHGMLQGSMDFSPEVLDQLKMTVDELADILTDNLSASDLYDSEATRTLYNQAFKRLNQGLARTIEFYLGAAKGPVSILELGAGFGSATKEVLPALQGRDCHYAFTDVSAFFLKEAKARFAEYDFVEYGLYDFDRDPALQGRGHHEFDLVIAASALHVAQDMRRTLDGLIRLLKPGGLLLTIEETVFHSWLDLSMGLQPGFERFQDTDLRPFNPLLDWETWHECLLAAGFERAQALYDQTSLESQLGAALLIAQMPASIDVFDSEKLVRQLGQRLPPYMIPKHHILLSSWPLTANGKLDRKALSIQETKASGQDAGRLPKGDKELALARMWSSLLDLEDIGAGEDFFELGGDSLLATRMVGLLKKEGYLLPLNQVFAEPILGRMAAVMTRLKQEDGPLMELKQGAGPPLVFIHAADGGIEAYRLLCPRLDTARPVFALAEDSFAAGEAFSQTAQRYADVIEAKWPHEPLTLAGFSSGGMLAWLTQAKLESMGRDPLPPILIDSQFRRPEAEDISPAQWLEAFAWVHGQTDWSAKKGEQKEIESLARELGMGLNEIRERLDSFKQKMLSLPLEPNGVHTKGLVFIRAKGRQGAGPEQMDLWSQACTGKTEVHELDLDHFQCLSQSGLKSLAGCLNQIIAKERRS